MKRLYSIIVCFLSIQWGYAQEQVMANYQYWIDQNGCENAIFKAINGTDVSFSIDTKNIPTGIHNLYFRLQDNDGMWSSLQSWLFFVCNTTKNKRVKTSQCEYWIDNRDKQKIKIDRDQISFVLDAIEIGEGLHTLNFRINDEEGVFGPLQTWIFIKKAQRDSTIMNKAIGVEYWFDDWSKVLQSYLSYNDTINFSVDATPLMSGLHTLSYRVKDIHGNFSHIHTYAFYKTESKTPKIRWYKYWWNNYYDKAVMETVEASGTEYVFNQELTIPEYVMKDGSSDNSTARFQIVFGDDMENISNIECVDITYLDAPVGINIVKHECSNIKVWSNNQFLHISGLQMRQLICIYDSNGALVYKGQANTTSMIIPLHKSGVYIVKIDNNSFKALVH